MKHQFIGDMQAGATVEDLFALAEKNLSRKKDGSPYLNIVLADKTASIRGVVWDNTAAVAESVAVGDVVRVNASVSEYRGALQLVVQHMAVVPLDEVDPADFLPVTSRNIEEMFGRLQKITSRVHDPKLKALICAFWDDATFVAKFKQAPAAKNMHHAYIGGLLEHTLSMVLLVERIAGHYSGINRDLLMAGAVFHDIGKVHEFEYRYSIDYSDKGRLLSHIVIGIEMVEEKIRQIPDFPAELSVLLKHMIVSHHGSREFGSPELPKTIEAILLHYVDEMDSKVNGIREFITSDSAEGAWTSYHRILGRHFYKAKT